MSLYGDYLKEHRSDEIIENEMSFVTYRYLDAKTVYIVDIYVVPKFRQSGLASAMADKVVRAAKDKGCTKLLGTVCPAAHGSTESLKVLLGYGMRLLRSDQSCITFEKDI